MIKLAAAMAAVLLVASAAGAQPAARVITQPDWQRKPTANDVARYYPELAVTLGMQGRASVTCQVNEIGDLVGCRISAESPLDMGFGAAAMKLAPLFRMRPKTVDGVPVNGGQIRVPIAFRIPRSEVRVPAPPPPRTAAALQLARRVSDGYGLVARQMAHYEEQARALEFTNNTAPEADRFAVADALRTVSRSHEAELRDAYAAAFASVYDDQELASLVGYLESPAGRATMREESNIAAIRQQLTLDYNRRLATTAHDAFCKSRDCDWRTAMARIFAAGEPADGHIDAPDWSLGPTPGEIAAAQPILPYQFALVGLARVTCKVDSSGWLERCLASEAWPRGFGYESAALKLAGRFRLSARQLGQGAAGETATVRLMFPAMDLPDPYDGPTARSAGTLSLARELQKLDLDAAGISATAESDFKALRDEVSPGADPALVDAAVSIFVSATGTARAAFDDQMANAVAAIYSEAELRGILAFRRSRVSKAIAEKATATSDATQAALVPVLDRIAGEVRARYCAGRACADAAAQTAASPPPSTRNP